MHFQTILHPTDYSESSQAALRYAVALASDHGANLIILHTVETLGPENVTFGQATASADPAEEYRRHLWEDLYRIKSPDARVKVDYVLSEDNTVDAIVNLATMRKCDLIVMGSHGRHGWRRWLSAGTAEQVMEQVCCPVLVVKASMTPKHRLRFSVNPPPCSSPPR